MKPSSDIKTYLLNADKTLAQVISVVKIEVEPSLDLDIYRALLHAIVSQQLSTKVAAVIWQRFLNLFPSGYPMANDILGMPHDLLRQAGLSNSKSNYVKNVAKFTFEYSLAFDDLNKMDDESIIDYLSKIKGVGRWTAQMILMFPMNRLNVFPINDLGLQRAMQKAYQLDLTQKELLVKMDEIAQLWDPYKTVASKYLWRYLDI